MTISIIMSPPAGAFTANEGALTARVSAGSTVCAVSTRLGDPRLLAGALADAGADRIVLGAEQIDVAWSDRTAHLRRDADGVWSADFAGITDEKCCVDTVLAIDRAYGLRVQQEVLRRLRGRVPAAGMTLVSETTNTDASVTMVLEVRHG
ncbi:hypothetical protein D5S18_17745 [Nocardia panacis]|uniref:Uncharacterized protein n=1 Tax=Nocardia panacis TaxID=2340916 RepID=A0A3A4KKH3_9NOCA|nr:hypothetical protein [Nocardia panacis]RJO75201.1 hypothetical protein D5S18_17745 [Nocardia panacis]